MVRPRVADLVFRLYSRPLHPELFDVLAVRTVERDGYTLSVRLTRTGHLLAWSRASGPPVRSHGHRGHGASRFRLLHRPPIRRRADLQEPLRIGPVPDQFPG